MAATFDLMPMQPFDPDAEPNTSAERWKKWIRRFQTYLIAANITNDTQKCAMLLYMAGPRVMDIFDTLPETGTDDEFDVAVTKLTAHFNPMKNTEFAVYNFRQTRQGEAEGIDQYYIRLKKLSDSCDFHDIDKEIKSQIVQCGISSRIRKKALRDPSLTLEKLLQEARAEEISITQATGIEENLKSLNFDEKESVQYATSSQVQSKRYYKSTNKNRKCCRCGGQYPHGQRGCPANGKECSKCHKSNHFARVCKTKVRNRKFATRTNMGKGNPRVHVVDGDEAISDETEVEYIYSMDQREQSKARPHAMTNVKIEGVKIHVTIDTGASINVMDLKTFNIIMQESYKKPILEPTKIRIFTYNAKEPLKVMGKFTTMLETKHRLLPATFYVTPGQSGCLLSGVTAQEGGLLSLHLHAITDGNRKNISVDIEKSSKGGLLLHNAHGDKKLQAILERNKAVFDAGGKLNDRQIKLHIDESIPGVIQPPCRIPYHLRKKVTEELQKLEKAGIIEKVKDAPTQWSSPIVITPKKDSNDIRICVDMRMPNTAIQRERHIMPTVKDLTMELNGAQYFSKLDLQHAYHQLELKPESRYITTFSTHEGLYQYTRLNYGTNSAAEIFQTTLQQVLHDLKGVKNMADDIIVYGSTREKHDVALENCLNRLQEKNLKLNLKKCRFLKENLEFYGLMFSKKGIAPDPKKVEDFVKATPPQSASEVRSLLGMATYSSQFIPNFASITAPLRELTKKHAKFEWTEKQQKAFVQLKEYLTRAPVMAYFDIGKKSMLTVDASPYGLSAILSQIDDDTKKPNIIAYASRSLTTIEQRYSQTEREALAIVWGMEHFRLYLYGCEFDLITDHKPLELIYKNPKSKPPMRIERWLLRLQDFNFKVIYQAGKDNIADYMSRHPVKEAKRENLAEQYVHFISENAVPKSMTLLEIQEESQRDPTIQFVMRAIETNDAENKDKMKSYADTRRNVRKNELKEGDQVIVKADQRKKLTPKYIPKRYVIKYKRGNQVTAERDGKVIKRNSTFFKKINSPIQESESESEYSDYSDNETDGHDYPQRNPEHNEPPINRRRYPLRERTQTHFYGQPIAHFSTN